MDAQTPWRTYDLGTKVYSGGTAAANQIPSGVFPGNGAMGVTAPGGMAVQVNAGYCCVANSSSALQGGYVFGLMTSQQFQVAAADPVNPRIDLVVAYVNDLGSDASASYVQYFTGTAAASPTAPTPPGNSLILASVSVPGGSTAITSSLITDERTYVVAPGGILPIQNAAAAPAVAASQFMYNLSTNQLCQGTGTAGQVALPTVLPWVPQIAVKTSNTLAGSAGALVTVQSVSVTVNGTTDLDMYVKWGGVEGSAQYLTIEVTIDGTVADSLNVVSTGGTSYPSAGGSAHFYTSSLQANTPAAGTHTIAMKFQAQGSGTSSNDGLYATSTSPSILRVAPVSV
jgi:hypothetical protein